MKFSVGRIQVGDDVLVKCTGITVRYDGGAVDFHAGGYQLPLETELGNMTVTISVDRGDWTGDIDPETVLPNTYVTVVLLASAADAERGLSSLTLSRCKARTWETASTQEGFVTYRMELSQTYS